MNRRDLEKKLSPLTSQLLADKGHIALIDIFLGLGYLSENDISEWRMKRVPYLEKCINLGLSKISFIIKIVRTNCINGKLKESHTAYRSWGKGAKINLRFSKSGDPYLEKIYSTHFIKPRNMA